MNHPLFIRQLPPSSINIFPAAAAKTGLPTEPLFISKLPTSSIYVFTTTAAQAGLPTEAVIY